MRRDSCAGDARFWESFDLPNLLPGEYSVELRFAPRFGLARQFRNTGLVFRAAYGIFYTPVDLNTWCNQLHNVPNVFPITRQSDNFTPSIIGFNFPQPVLGKTVTSFTAFRPPRGRAVSGADLPVCLRGPAAREFP